MDFQKLQRQADANSQLTPRKAIRAKCLDCAGGSYQEVRLCCVFDCPLWPHRSGRQVDAKRRQDASQLGVYPTFRAAYGENAESYQNSKRK